MNVKRKGTAAENELLHLLHEYGIRAERNEQGLLADFIGGFGNPDILAKIGGEELHVEVKRTERLQLNAAIKQAERDCAGRIPVIAHRRNRDCWRVTLTLNDFLTLVGAAR